MEAILSKFKFKTMNTIGLNLFIVDENPLMVSGLQHYLYQKFGSHLNISTYYNAEIALEKVDEKTRIVVLDYNLKGKKGTEVLKSIKKIN